MRKNKRNASKQRHDLDRWLSFKQLASICDVHYLTCFRWHSRGIKVGRSRVKLRTMRLTNRHVTTLRWYHEFLAAQQANPESRDELLAASQESIERQLENELSS